MSLPIQFPIALVASTLMLILDFSVGKYGRKTMTTWRWFLTSMIATSLLLFTFSAGFTLGNNQARDEAAHQALQQTKNTCLQLTQAEERLPEFCLELFQ